jgi:hypothetical protein
MSLIRRLPLVARLLSYLLSTAEGICGSFACSPSFLNKQAPAFSMPFVEKQSVTANPGTALPLRSFFGESTRPNPDSPSTAQHHNKPATTT